MRRDPPGWVRPERLPDDLPPQEQWVEQPWEVWGAPAQHPPPTAPGFARAASLCLLPPLPPETPPALLPGRSARQLAGLALGAFLSPLLVLPFVQSGSVLAFAALGYGLAAFFVTVRLLAAHHAREEQEALHGYTTMWGSPGLWRLAQDGHPVRPPDRTILPPGFYPSPYWPGVLQKWDGPGWRPFTRRWYRKPEGWFRTPPTPYL